MCAGQSAAPAAEQLLDLRGELRASFDECRALEAQLARANWAVAGCCGLLPAAVLAAVVSQLFARSSAR